MEITIQQAQQQVDHWIKTVGVRYFSELTNTAILNEEVGELCRLMARIYGEQSFKKSELEKYLGSMAGLEEAERDLYRRQGKLPPVLEKQLLADEMADVLWVLICLANQTGVDLTEALQRNFEKKNIRDVDRHRDNKKLS
jgi:NTP pyrophosphatase (non-canonical NTP hydrolase)